MNNRPQSPSLLAFICRDYHACSYVLLIISGWIACVFFLSVCSEPVRPEEAWQKTLLIGLGLATGILTTSIFLPHLLGRHSWICRMLETGTRVCGEIRGVSYYRGRVEVFFEYTNNGIIYQLQETALRNQPACCYVQGQTVDVVVNRDDPADAYIEELLVEPAPQK